MSDEKTDALDFTMEERAAADGSFVDPEQWDVDEEAPVAEGASEVPEAEEPAE